MISSKILAIQNNFLKKLLFKTSLKSLTITKGIEIAEIFVKVTQVERELKTIYSDDFQLVVKDPINYVHSNKDSIYFVWKKWNYCLND